MFASMPKTLGDWRQALGGWRRAYISNKSFSSTPARTIIAIVVVTLVIFVADVLTDVNIVVGVLFVVPVLMAGRVFERRGFLILTLIFFVLTWLGIPPWNGIDTTAIANAVIACVAIGTTALLVLREQSTQKAFHDAHMQLAHMNRLATMGHLTASIAHEIKQPIGTARNNAASGLRFLSRTPPDLEEVRDALKCVVNDANRAGEIIDRIRAQVRKAPPRKDRLAINDAILEVVALTHSEAVKNGVSVQTQLAEGLPVIEGDRVQLQQVILNLIVNAIEAMSGQNEARELLISAEKAAPDGVLVAVRDSGPGLAPETLEPLFDAFYTTKANGMGMGLSICRSIIEAHGGRLWAIANERRGAVFQFTAPANPDIAF
jgi:C4-dicarboxylate-specific signal transduction histidine kinase